MLTIFLTYTIQHSIEIAIALLLCYNAYRQTNISKNQNKINKTKIDVDVFNKRIDLYNSFRKLLLEFSSTCKYKSEEFKQLIITSQFLFSSEIVEHLQLILKDLSEYDVLSMQLEKDIKKYPINSKERSEACEKNGQLFLSIVDNLHLNSKLNALFKDEISIKN